MKTQKEINKIKKEIESLCKKHLKGKNWKIDYKNVISYYGKCFFKSKKIIINKNLLERGKKQDIIDTTLHEIAHAMLPPRILHGNKWKIVCRNIGCSGEITGDVLFKIKSKYKITIRKNDKD